MEKIERGIELLPQINLKWSIERFLTSPDGRVSSRRPLSPSMSRDSASTRLSRINLLSLPRDNDVKVVFQHCDGNFSNL